jgi:hypothetical protein
MITPQAIIVEGLQVLIKWNDRRSRATDGQRLDVERVGASGRERLSRGNFESPLLILGTLGGPERLPGIP